MVTDFKVSTTAKIPCVSCAIGAQGFFFLNAIKDVYILTVETGGKKKLPEPPISSIQRSRNHLVFF